LYVQGRADTLDSAGTVAAYKGLSCGIVVRIPLMRVNTLFSCLSNLAG
jgi:hypothetical protein